MRHWHSPAGLLSPGTESHYHKHYLFMHSLFMYWRRQTELWLSCRKADGEGEERKIQTSRLIGARVHPEAAGLSPVNIAAVCSGLLCHEERRWPLKCNCVMSTLWWITAMHFTSGVGNGCGDSFLLHFCLHSLWLSEQQMSYFVNKAETD